VNGERETVSGIMSICGKGVLPYLLMFFLLISIGVSGETCVFRIYHYQRTIPPILLESGLDIASVKPGVYVDVVLDEDELDALLEKIPYFHIEKYETESELKQRLDSEYRTYPEIVTLLNNYEMNYSTICKLYDIGDAWEKTVGGSTYNANYESRDILMLKVSDNPGIDEEEPEILFIGVHHAREPISGEMVLYIINELLTGYGSNPDYTRWVDDYELYFIPVLNPDGFSVVLSGDNIWWRKNCRDNDGNKSYIASNDGVDLNRNYGWYWGGTGSSSNPYDEIYRGTGPFSEPEVLAIKKLANKHNFYISLSFHTYGEICPVPLRL